MSFNLVDEFTLREDDTIQKQVMYNDLTSCGDEEFARKCRRIKQRAESNKMPYGLESREATELVHSIAAMRGIYLR